MTKLLSQEEIDTLLASAGEVQRANQKTGSAHEPTAYVYNFRRPDRVTKEQIRALQFLHDRFARNVSTSLSAYLRTPTTVAVQFVEAYTYAEFLASLPDPTVFYALSVPSKDLLCALELNPDVAFAVVDRLLGGDGDGLSLSRALTDIEQNVVDAAIALIVDNLSEAWAPIADIGFRISGRETRPQMLQVATPNEQFIVVACTLKIADVSGMLHISMPADLIEVVGSQFSRGWQRAHRKPTEDEGRRLRARLAAVPFRVAAQLETAMPVRELIALQPGDVVTVGRAVTHPVDVQVGGSVKFSAQLVRCGQRAGVRIEEYAGSSALAESA